MAVKSVHTIVLDAGPIIRGEPSISTLLQRCEKIVSTPEVIAEIRDESTRSRLQTTLMPFITLQSPKPESVKFVAEFARKTGDLSVLSKTDLNVIALAYDLECERNGGDWRLRSAPGQKRTNAPMPAKQSQGKESEGNAAQKEELLDEDHAKGVTTADAQSCVEESVVVGNPSESEASELKPDVIRDSAELGTTILIADTNDIISTEDGTKLDGTKTDLTEVENEIEAIPGADSLVEKVSTVHLSDQSDDQEFSDDSDSGGWITPFNIKKVQNAEDAAASSGEEQKVMQVATITTDYAMQNVLMQINLNLISPSLQKIRHIKNFLMRCHACFNVVKDMSKQFCPRCGKPTLTRVTCSTNAQGEFKMHLKKNMQWNTRGDRFSIPKPVPGTANGRHVGGGKDGWGSKLVLAEDQKEYVRAIDQDKRIRARDLMDEDYMPSILSGERKQSGGRPKVGAGRTVNSRKRK